VRIRRPQSVEPRSNANAEAEDAAKSAAIAATRLIELSDCGVIDMHGGQVLASRPQEFCQPVRERLNHNFND
jgi:hypothetical protein